MASILYTTSFGSDDPTRASIPFVLALGAVEAGHTAQIALLGEASYLMKSYIAEDVKGVGVGPFKELLANAVEAGIAIHI